jgi:predicted transcriptional regulator
MTTQSTQNITLALPRSVLRRAKVIAAQRRVSLSRLLTEALDDLVKRETGYAQARRRQQARLAQGFDLGTRGRLATTRESLHQR